MQEITRVKKLFYAKKNVFISYIAQIQKKLFLDAVLSGF